MAEGLLDEVIDGDLTVATDTAPVGVTKALASGECVVVTDTLLDKVLIRVDQAVAEGIPTGLGRNQAGIGDDKARSALYIPTIHFRGR